VERAAADGDFHAACSALATARISGADAAPGANSERDSAASTHPGHRYLKKTTVKEIGVKPDLPGPLDSYSFWCTTCHSCRHVDQHLAKLAKDYSGKAVVLALDANADESAREVAAMLKNAGLDLPVSIDLNGKVADVFGITKTTTTVVIDGDGRQATHGSVLMTLD
jgi:thiol-disulfide isomerase/thioredoxin